MMNQPGRRHDAKSEADQTLRQVRGLLKRLMGDRSECVDVELIESNDGLQRYEHEIVDGRIKLRGTDGIAIAAAAKDLTSENGAHCTWDSSRWLTLPRVLGDSPRVMRSTDLKHRYYLNFVTFGYTTAFWNWTRWEREIDWMALHGINLPLMTVGHEAVLLETYRELGLSDERILEWIGGAAHFPWTWMGGTNEWGGPLPTDWIPRHLDLARRILDRQHGLGMTPVLPGFMGHVPPQLAPEGTRRIEWQGWSTPVLSPGDPEFQQFAEVFYRHQRNLLGTNHYYAVDPFIESVPPSGEPKDLGNMAAGIFEAMKSADPSSVWVLQGWPFHYHSEFWTEERVRAFLEPVPVESMVLLDLWAEHAPMWKRTEGLWGRRWLWCAVHNFGSRPAVFGDVRGLRRDLAAVKSDPNRGNLVGVGITTEAIENNSVFYELLTDLVWDPMMDEDKWLDRFVRSRYGVDSQQARKAWSILTRTLYGPGRTRSTPSPVIARPWTDSAPFAAQRLAGEFIDTESDIRPSANTDAENDPAVLGDLALIADAVDLLLGLTSNSSVDHDTLDRDIVDITSHVIAQHSRLAIRGILAGYADKDAEQIRVSAKQLDESLVELDRLVGSREDSRVARWLDSARTWARNETEAQVLERDARRLISVWGHQTSGLHDYSGRHWQGLIDDLYRKRWAAWAEWLADATAEGAVPNLEEIQSKIVEIEESWVGSQLRYAPIAHGDVAELAGAAIARRRPEIEPLRRSEPGLV